MNSETAPHSTSFPASTHPHVDGASLEAEVAALKEQISDTREIYRAVCALLFFKHRTTPTGTRLYSLVRKGTASLPNEVLASFWEELRERSRVDVDHPGLPDALKRVAAAAFSEIWSQAVHTAHESLAMSRAESEQAVDRAQELIDAERERASMARREQADAEEALASVQQMAQGLQDTLDEERRGHASTRGRADEMERQIAALTEQLARAQETFTSEVSAVREAASASLQRAEAGERRALLLTDQARTAQLAAERQIEVLRATLESERATARKEASARVAENATLKAQVDETRTTVARLTEELRLALKAAATSAADASAATARADTVLAMAQINRPKGLGGKKHAGRAPAPDLHK